MKSIFFAITVFFFIGVIFVVTWLFDRYDISYGAIKESYYRIGAYAILLGWIAMLYEQRLRALSLPGWMALTPLVYGVCILFFDAGIPKIVMLGIHAANALFFLILLFKKSRGRIQ